MAHNSQQPQAAAEMQGQNATEAPVLVDVRGATGILTLNRPQALNSLNLEMVRIIAEAIGAWRDDASIAQVVIRSSGKHFCAGGDVRAAREGILAGRVEEVDDFFRTEYAMNLAIATLDKPFVALVGGVDMGGGLGVSAHGSHVVVTEDAFASMPEMNIGFITDVGMSWLLSRLPKHPSAALGMFLALTGYRLTADDMLATGLATHKVASLEGLAELIADEGIGVLEEHALAPGASELEKWFDAIEVAFGAAEIKGAQDDRGTWAQIVDSLDREPQLREWVATLTAQASPSALVAAAELMRFNSAPHIDLATALDNERRVGALLSREPDFAEGVRAVLVDKTKDARFSAEPAPEKYRALLRA